MLMNSQVPTIQDPSTQQQLQNMQLQQALAQQTQQPGTPAMPQVQSPWSGAAMLVNALTSPTQQQGQGASGASTTPLQSLISWLNSGSSNDAAGPEDDDQDSAGGS